jgi:L-malate glycosyltransferase
VESGREWRGGQRQVWLLARELAREAGVDQRLVTRRGGELARRAAASGVPVRGAPWAAGLDPRAWWRLVRELRAFRPAVIHAHNSHALTLARWARAALPRSGRAARPALVATRRVVFPVRPASALFAADRVIAVSAAVRASLLRAGLPAGRIVLVPSGVDPVEVQTAALPPLDLAAQLGLPAGTPLAVNLAALEPAKDQATLVRAAARATALRPELHWVIAGVGPLAAPLDALRRRLGVAERVHLVGWVDRPEALLAAAAVVVMSSREEGLGTVVLDARALGKRVVATAAGGLPEIVPAEWVVPVGDAAALAQTVVRALEHPPPPAALSAPFTAAAMARGVLAAYRALA